MHVMAGAQLHDQAHYVKLVLHAVLTIVWFLQWRKKRMRRLKRKRRRQRSK